MLTSIKQDRKSTRLNSSHLGISYAVFCLKKKTIGKLFARALGRARHADLVEELDCSAAMAGRERRAEAEDLAVVAHQRHLYVLDHGHRTAGRRALKGAADAEPPNVARPQSDDAAIGEFDIAVIGRELPVDHVETGRFPRVFCFNDRQTSEFYTLSLHDALPI